MKVAFVVANNLHKSGEFPVHYNGLMVGKATLSNNGDTVLVEIDTITQRTEDEQKVIQRLVSKLGRNQSGMSTFGNVDYGVISSHSMLEANPSGFAINDLPDYIPST